MENSNKDLIYRLQLAFVSVNEVLKYIQENISESKHYLNISKALMQIANSIALATPLDTKPQFITAPSSFDTMQFIGVILTYIEYTIDFGFGFTKDKETLQEKNNFIESISHFTSYLDEHFKTKNCQTLDENTDMMEYMAFMQQIMLTRK